MSTRGIAGEAELTGYSVLIPSLHATPIAQDYSFANSLCKSACGSRPLQPGDWRLAAAAKTDGTPVRPPGDDESYGNIDDTHSSITTSADGEGAPTLAVEASFRLDLPPRQLDTDGELSTPGSDGYSSPKFNFEMDRPDPIVQSNNPLFVDRPSPALTAKDGVARTLVLSPCAGPSPEARPSRRTRESLWSSDVSASRSVSFNSQAQHNRDMESPLSLLATAGAQTPRVARAITPVASPVPFALQQREDAPSPFTELVTPRRAIMALSGKGPAAQAASGVASAAAPSKQQEPETPCSAPKAPDVGGKAAVLAAAAIGTVAVTAPPSPAAAPVRVPRSPPRATPGTKSDTARDSAASPPGAYGLASRIEADDTAGPRRALDQTPRKGSKSCIGDSGKAAKDGAGNESGVQAPSRAPATSTSSTMCGQTAEGAAMDAGPGPAKANRRGSSSGGRLWGVLAPLVVVAVVASIACFTGNSPATTNLVVRSYLPVMDSISSFSRTFSAQPSMPSVGTMAPGPVDQDRVEKVVDAISTLPQPPFCWSWSLGPSTHVLDSLFVPVERVLSRRAATDTTSMAEATSTAIPAAADSSAAMPPAVQTSPDSQSLVASASEQDAADAGCADTDTQIPAAEEAAPAPELWHLVIASQDAAIELPGGAQLAQDVELVASELDAVAVVELQLPAADTAVAATEVPAAEIVEQTSQQTAVEHREEADAPAPAFEEAPAADGAATVVDECAADVLLADIGEPVAEAVADDSALALADDDAQPSFLGVATELEEAAVLELHLPIVSEALSEQPAVESVGSSAEQSGADDLPAAAEVQAEHSPATPAGEADAVEVLELHLSVVSAAVGEQPAVVYEDSSAEQSGADDLAAAAEAQAEHSSATPADEADAVEVETPIQPVAEQATEPSSSSHAALEEAASCSAEQQADSGDVSAEQPLTPVWEDGATVPEATEDEAAVTLVPLDAAAPAVDAQTVPDMAPHGADLENSAGESAAPGDAPSQLKQQWSVNLKLITAVCCVLAGLVLVVTATVLALALGQLQQPEASSTPAPATPARRSAEVQELATPFTPLTSSTRILKLKGPGASPYGGNTATSADDDDQAMRTPEPGTFVYIQNKLTYVERI